MNIPLILSNINPESAEAVKKSLHSAFFLLSFFVILEIAIPIVIIIVIVKIIKNSKAKKQEEINHYKEIENKIDQINEKLNDL